VSYPYTTFGLGGGLDFGLDFWAVHKRCPQCGHFADKGKGFFRWRTSEFFKAKTSDIFGMYGVSARTRGVEPERRFFRKG